MHRLGIDFGTSNSACGVLVNGKPHLIEIEPGEKTLPTSVFFDYDSRRTLFGSAANRALIQGVEGRFMRALKSVLGTPLMRERRQLLNESVDFIDIVSRFLAHLKTGAEAACHVTFDHAVSGRPVHFHGGRDRDGQAAADLAECYQRAGFSQVTFMYEPEAAALASGAQAGGLGLIVDIGGGTSDFTVFDGATVLASHGVRIGGTHFDRALSLDHAMPLLGAGSELRNAFGGGVLPAPVKLWQTLASWEKIPFLYTPQTRRDVAAMARQAVQPRGFERLQEVLEMETGHDIAFAVERGKIAANTGAGRIDLAVVEPGLGVALAPPALQASLHPLAEGIQEAALHTCTLANLRPSEIAQVVFVGGSSLMQVVIDALSAAFPEAIQNRSDPFTGVVDGLAIKSGA